MNYARHHLGYLDKNTRLISSHTPDQYNLFYYWLQRGYPFIFTRQPQELSNNHVQLALPYVNKTQDKKLRQSYIMEKSWVTQIKELPALAEIFPTLTQHAPNDIRVYGSYCWQYLTQEQYLHPASDLDVLLTYSHQSLAVLAELHQTLAQETKVPRVDGEIRFPHFGDCSWQELLQINASETILFKSLNNLILLRREYLYATYPTLFS